MARPYTLHRPLATSGIDYAAALNAEQYAAVASPPGKALVIAGAGSGKTRTLTYRVAWLLDHGVEPRQVLLLTFTNKAAREMVGRVRDLIARDTSDLWAGTFHSVGSRILRRHAELLGFTRSFSILDRDDQKSMISKVVAACAIHTKERQFPKADVLASIFSLIENSGTCLEQIIANSYHQFYDWINQIEQVRLGYIEKKRASNAMDFDDLLVLTVRLFEDRPEVLDIYQKRFRHILVDEYQDTNLVQGRMIDMLAGESNSLMAVGDDAQSIYSWRGADMAHILGFPKHYAGAQVFTIDTNYRSVPELLDLSNASIRANLGRFEKDLRSAREAGGVRPALVALNEPRAQASFVVQRMLEMHDSGVPLAEMAVLYRAHFHSLELQMELTVRQIPFILTSGLRFFEQAHIKDVSAFLRFVTNRRDEESFLRLVMMLPGCGPVAAEKLWREWLNTGWAARDELPIKFSEVMLPFKKVPKKGLKAWQQLCFTLDELAPNGFPAKPAAMIYSVMEGVYKDYLEASFENFESRHSDLDQLSRYSEKFEDIVEFLSQLSLMGSVDGQPGAADNTASEDKVTLSSIHQAKGLEWQLVFVIWLVDGQFPNGRILETENLPMLEEERRLFYVAITRAKDHLYLTYPQTNPKSYTGDSSCQPSRFLSDFPPELVEEWNVTSPDPWGEDSPF